jgi:hypothetical protein
MTTPLNVTFAPFGMDCMFEVGLIFLGTGCCPQAAGAANNSANPHTMANGRSFLISLAFIFSIRLLFFSDGECNGSLQKVYLCQTV